MSDHLPKEVVVDRYRFARARLAMLERDGGSDIQLRQAERHARYWTDQLIRASKSAGEPPVRYTAQSVEDTVGWVPPGVHTDQR